ncbi:hypothetical protein [Rhodospirillaceae bacterium SYSU D60014]|uniref:ATP-grasp domain-containing protein n=1 Tax=Virgifigura deserti TaxID=2268457 RepID=UPI000E66C07D
MSRTIAIQPDTVRHKNGEEQSFSARWVELAEQIGIQARMVDAFAPDFFQQIVGCDGFLWRFGYPKLPRAFAKRLLPAIEHGMGIPVFPDWRTAWHFEDKIAQSYLLEAAGIPIPRTWVFWRPEDAIAFCHGAAYPLVMKLSYGYQSANVRLLQRAEEATYWVQQMFGPGIKSVQMPTGARANKYVRRFLTAARTLAGRTPLDNSDSELQQGYVLFQEFLPGNEFDTRITIIGNRAFGFRRFNRPNDFRASGSGHIDWDPKEIDIEAVRLAFDIAQRFQTQSVAVDVLRRGAEPVIAEISYTYASWALRDCPGHWMLRGDNPETGELEWVEGQMRPEDAIFEDFIARIRLHSTTAISVAS